MTQDTIYPAPVTLQLYEKTLVFTIKFTLNFFLPPPIPSLLPVLLSVLVRKLPLKVLFIISSCQFSLSAAQPKPPQLS